MKLTRRERFSLIICGIVVLGALGFTWIIKPSLQKWGAIERAISQGEARLEKYALILEKDYQNRLSESRLALEKHRSRFYLEQKPELATNRLLQDLEGIVRKAGVEIENKKTLAGKQTGNYYQISVMFNLKGNSSQLVDLLYEIEASSKRLLVPYLDISKTEDSRELLISLVVSSLNIPWAGLPASPPGPASETYPVEEKRKPSQIRYPSLKRGRLFTPYFLPKGDIGFKEPILEGIVWGTGRRVAIIREPEGNTTYLLKEGEEVSGWKIKKITARSVALRKEGQELILRLKYQP